MNCFYEASGCSDTNIGKEMQKRFLVDAVILMRSQSSYVCYNLLYCWWLFYIVNIVIFTKQSFVGYPYF